MNLVRKTLSAIALSTMALGGSAAVAQQAMTVQGLLDQGYAVVSSIWTANVGPGLFLQKDRSLYLCFVKETPDNSPLATQYCKEVH